MLEDMMDLVESLRSKKIKATEIPKWGTYLRKKWEDHFANHLSDKEKKSIYLYDEDGCSGFLWHLFSYKKRSSTYILELLFAVRKPLFISLRADLEIIIG